MFACNLEKMNTLMRSSQKLFGLAKVFSTLAGKMLKTIYIYIYIYIYIVGDRKRGQPKSTLFNYYYTKV